MTSVQAPEVTVIVPAKNEEDTIAEVVRRLLALPIQTQIIVVDDGSTDGTAAQLSQFGSAITVLRNSESLGKGAAIRTALPHAVGEVVVIQDADLEYEPEELPNLVRPILDGKANVVYGTRFLHGMPKGMAWPNRIVNWLLAWTVRLLFWRRLTDEATCYKAIRTSLLRSLDLQCRRFEFCPEVTAKVLRKGERIVEVGIRYHPRSKDAGKKIRWTDAPVAFWTLLKYRFSKRTW
jgi:glycosyltransferase involved in cell wall biosynthesis